MNSKFCGLISLFLISTHYRITYYIYQIKMCRLQHTYKTISLYSKTCLNRTLNKPESCINHIKIKVPMMQIFVNLTCINRTPVYSEHKSCSQGGSIKTGFTVLLCSGCLISADFQT